MDLSSQVSFLQKDVQELEQMNGSLLRSVAQLECELKQTQSRASEAEAQIKVVCVERDELRRKFDAVSEEHRLLRASTGPCLASSNLPTQEIPQDDLRSALLEIERFENLLRTEREQRAELESRLALQKKVDVENGLSHSLEVSELERMNTMLAAENAALQEKISKVQLTSQQSSSFYNTEPCAEPEQDESCNANRDSLTQWYLTK